MKVPVINGSYYFDVFCSAYCLQGMSYHFCTQKTRIVAAEFGDVALVGPS